MLETNLIILETWDRENVLSKLRYEKKGGDQKGKILASILHDSQPKAILLVVQVYPGGKSRNFTILNMRQLHRYVPVVLLSDKCRGGVQCVTQEEIQHSAVGGLFQPILSSSK